MRQQKQLLSLQKMQPLQQVLLLKLQKQQENRLLLL
jgi:hypothetical protein